MKLFIKAIVEIVTMALLWYYTPVAIYPLIVVGWVVVRDIVKEL